MSVWDITTPAGSDPKSQGDDRIRELKSAIQEALRGGASEGDEAVFPGPNPSTAPEFHYRGLKGSTGSRPAAGFSGLYFDTDRLVIQRDNGSTWEDVGSVMPAGTVIPFYQAAAPVGWTKVATQDDKVLRVVSGTGGGSGGVLPTSTTLAHDHAHTHTISHKHVSPVGNNLSTAFFALSTSGSWGAGTESRTADIHAGALAGVPAQTVNFTKTQDSDTPNSGANSAAPHLDVLAYIDMILASKD